MSTACQALRAQHMSWVLQTSWGGHSLVKATRILMKAALEDPYNQRFQLLCETTIPVRSAFFTHQQLLAQNMSRVGDPHEVPPCLLGYFPCMI